VGAKREAIRSWFRGLGRSAPRRVNLLESPAQQIKPPGRLGLDLDLQLRAWSATRLATIFRQADRHPSEDSLLEARYARHCLSSCWLNAPVDLLEEWYSGSLGDLQRSLLEGPLPQQPLSPDELQWRDRLAQELEQRFEAPQRINLLLALMPYFPPLTLKVEDPLEQLPDWLLKDYAVYCDPELKARLQGPAGLLQPSGARPAITAELPVLSERRGQEAMAWVEQPQVVNRLAALINLYGLDPADDPTRAELAAVRNTIAQLWLDVVPEQLEPLYRSAVGTLTRSLIASGFSREDVSGDEPGIRQLLAAQLEDLSQPRAINSLLAVLLYVPLRQVEIEAGAQFIPAWLLQDLQQL
jgi:hypothetical protein